MALHVEAALRRADVARGGGDALGLQSREDAVPPAVLAADQAFRRNAHVVEAGATASSPSAAIISSCICGVMALRFSGRCIVTQAMSSAISTFTVCNFGKAIAPPARYFPATSGQLPSLIGRNACSAGMVEITL